MIASMGATLFIDLFKNRDMHYIIIIIYTQIYKVTYNKALLASQPV